jgi:uncharacterized membrane protein
MINNHLLWNLFLAVIPVVLAWTLAWGLTRQGKQRHLPLLVCIPLAVAWLVFLPNTCYLLTQWRHLLFDARWEGLLDAGHADRYAMLSTAKWSLFFLVYSGTGVILFTLAIRPMERWLRSIHHKFYLYAPFFFFLMSFGVYLGLIPRANSWDILTNPLWLWQQSLSALSNPTLMSAIIVFALILWALYEAIDLWIDGVAERLHRWGILRSPARARATA